VNFLEAFLLDGTLWVIMEYVEGSSLTGVIEAWKDNGGLSEPVISFITKKVAIGLQYLHRHNIIHRDVKSDNILVRSDRFFFS
jgi:serine/threonine protein kinase